MFAFCVDCDLILTLARQAFVLKSQGLPEACLCEALSEHICRKSCLLLKSKRKKSCGHGSKMILTF